MAALQPCRLLAFPGELRNVIYEHLFDDLGTSSWMSRDNIKFVEATSSHSQASITETCREFRAETLVYYREVLAEHWKSKVLWFNVVKDGWPAEMLGEFGDACESRLLMPMVRRLEQMTRIAVRTRDCHGEECTITLRRMPQGGRIQAREMYGRPWLLLTSTMLGGLEFVW